MYIYIYVYIYVYIYIYMHDLCPPSKTYLFSCCTGGCSVVHVYIIYIYIYIHTYIYIYIHVCINIDAYIDIYIICVGINISWLDPLINPWMMPATNLGRRH